MERLALVLHRQAKHDDAVELLQSALDIRRSVQGDAHVATRRTADELRRLQETYSAEPIEPDVVPAPRPRRSRDAQ